MRTPTPQQCLFCVPWAASWGTCPATCPEGCSVRAGGAGRCSCSQLPASWTPIDRLGGEGILGTFRCLGVTWKRWKYQCHTALRVQICFILGVSPLLLQEKKKIWTTHCSLHGDRLSGGWMECRLGTREPGARTKLPAQWQRSLLGTRDPRRAAGLRLQNDFPKCRTRGSANSQVTKACSCLLLTRVVRLSKELAAFRRGEEH